MKSNDKLRSLLAGSALLASLIGGAQAQTQYYYDNSAAGPTGFGNAGQTWGTHNVISTDSTGAAAGSNPTTTVNDTLNLGSATHALGGGTITVGTRSIGSIIRNSTSNSGIISFNSGTTTFATNGVVTNNGVGTSLSFDTLIAGGATSMTFTTVGTNTNISLSNAGNTYAGATIIGANTLLRVSSVNDGGVASTLGSSNSNASNLVFGDGAALRFDNTIADSTNRNFRIDGTTAELYVRGNGDVLLSGTASYGTLNQAATLRLNSSSAITGDGDFNGILTDNGTGQLSLVKIGSSQTAASAWTLSNANTFTGSTTITGGILVLGNANAIQSSYIDTTASATGTTTTGLRTTGSALNLGGLSGDKNLSNIYTTSTGGYGSVTGITLNLASANNISYSGVIDGARSLTKTGAGTQTLTGTNTYSGATSVTAGRLAIDGSLANTSGVTVSGTGILQGSGVIASSVTIQSGGTLAPGNSIESLTTGDLSFEANSTYAYEIQTNLHGTTPDLAADLTDSTGSLNIAAGAILTLTDLATTTALLNGTKFTLISYFGGWTSGELFSYDAGSGLTTLADNSTFTLGANQWLFDYDDSTGGLNFASDQSGASHFVTMTVIPEPRAALLGCLGVLLILRRRR